MNMYTPKQQQTNKQIVLIKEETKPEFAPWNPTSPENYNFPGTMFVIDLPTFLGPDLFPQWVDFSLWLYSGGTML